MPTVVYRIHAFHERGAAALIECLRAGEVNPRVRRALNPDIFDVQWPARVDSRTADSSPLGRTWFFFWQDGAAMVCQTPLRLVIFVAAGPWFRAPIMEPIALRSVRQRSVNKITDGVGVPRLPIADRKLLTSDPELLHPGGRVSCPDAQGVEAHRLSGSEDQNAAQAISPNHVDAT